LRAQRPKRMTAEGPHGRGGGCGVISRKTAKQKKTASKNPTPGGSLWVTLNRNETQSMEALDCTEEACRQGGKRPEVCAAVGTAAARGGGGGGGGAPVGFEEEEVEEAVDLLLEPPLLHGHHAAPGVWIPSRSGGGFVRVGGGVGSIRPLPRVGTLGRERPPRGTPRPEPWRKTRMRLAKWGMCSARPPDRETEMTTRTPPAKKTTHPPLALAPLV